MQRTRGGSGHRLRTDQSELRRQSVQFSAHLLGIANAQNDFRDPKAAASGSQADIFARQLQSRLLSALSSQIVDAIFGENPQQSGTIKFGGQTITFVRGLTEVTLTITDDGTGEVTTIVIPTFIDVN